MLRSKVESVPERDALLIVRVVSGKKVTVACPCPPVRAGSPGSTIGVMGVVGTGLKLSSRVGRDNLP